MDQLPIRVLAMGSATAATAPHVASRDAAGQGEPTVTAAMRSNAGIRAFPGVLPGVSTSAATGTVVAAKADTAYVPRVSGHASRLGPTCSYGSRPVAWSYALVVLRR